VAFIISVQAGSRPVLFKWSAVVAWLEEADQPTKNAGELPTVIRKYRTGEARDLTLATNLNQKDIMSGDELRKMRAAMKLKQEELGTLLEVSERGIRRWENGEVDIPKIAEFAMRYLAKQKRRKGSR
jgi:DNA-binding transcriptional regulator YiaG